MNIYTYVFMYIYTYIFINIYIHICTCIHMYIHMYMSMMWIAARQVYGYPNDSYIDNENPGMDIYELIFIHTYLHVHSI
jgi:hypothetical protein